MTSITEVARLAGVSIATASRVVSAADYPVSAATRERVLEAARTLDYVPNALARGLLKSQVPVVGVIVHDITDPYFAEVVRGVEDAASAAGYLVITCSSERDADRERVVRPAAALDARGGRRVRGLRPRRPGAATRRWTATSRRCAPTARRSSTSRRTPHGEPEVGVDNAAGIAAMVARARRARPPADRVPRRAVVAVRRRASGSPATGAGSRRRASSTTSGWSCGTAFDAGGGRARRRRAARMPASRSPRSLRQRPARAGRAPAAGRARASTCRAPSRWRASTTSRPRR